MGRDKKVKRKGILYEGMVILLCISVVVCIAMACVVYVSQRLAEESAERVVRKAHDHMTEQLNTYLNSMERVAYAVAYSPSVRKAMLSENIPLRLMSNAEEIRSVFSAGFVYSPYIVGISLYDSERDYLISSGDSYYGVGPLEEKFAEVMQGTYSGASENGSDVTQIVYVYPLFDTEVGKYKKPERLGYLVFTLDANFLRTLILQGDFYEDTLLTVTDQEGREMLSNPTEGATHVSDLYVLKKDTFHIQTEIEKSGWKLHSIMATVTIAAEMRPLLYLVWGTAILLLITVFWMYGFFRHSILKPLNDLQRFIAELPDAHKRISLKSRPENELLETMQLLNKMLDSLEAQEEALVWTQTKALEEKTARQQMEIIAYRNQVNPHFLYNTLDCIRGIAYMHNVPEIIGISEALSAMFRYAVKGNDFVPLEKEVAYVRNYATIINYRFSGRIRIHFDISTELLHCQVIKLLLQPLVENAVLHGLETKMGEGNITVAAHRSGAQLCFQVTDDGCGMNEKKRTTLNERLNEVRQMRIESYSEQDGIGLMNIAHRLFLHYGKNYILRVLPGINQGTVIEIQIPEEGEANV